MAKLERFITPVVKLLWPKALRVAEGFGDGKASFKANFVFSTDTEEAEFTKLLKSKAKELLPRVKSVGLPMRRNKAGELITDDDERQIFLATSKYQPAIFDAHNDPIPQEVGIGGGSLARLLLSFNPVDKFSRLSLYLNQAQIIELVEWEGSKQSSAFEATEGYKVEKQEAGVEEVGDEDY